MVPTAGDVGEDGTASLAWQGEGAPGGQAWSISSSGSSLILNFHHHSLNSHSLGVGKDLPISQMINRGSQKPHSLLNSPTVS